MVRNYRILLPKKLYHSYFSPSPPTCNKHLTEQAHEILPCEMLRSFLCNIFYRFVRSVDRKQAKFRYETCMQRQLPETGCLVCWIKPYRGSIRGFWQRHVTSGAERTLNKLRAPHQQLCSHSLIQTKTLQLNDISS